MPHKKQLAKKSKRVISDNLRTYLLTGVRKKGDAQGFHLSGNFNRLRLIWDAVKDEIMTGWIKENPCARPYAFWLFDAPERRRKVSGSGDGWRPGMAIDSEGEPKYWQLSWKKKDPPCFESQAGFLERYNFLNDVERKILKGHPELLEPERIEFDDE